MDDFVAQQRQSREKLGRARDLRRQLTPAERLLWDHHRAHRLHGFHFRRQQIIDGFIVDFYCHVLGLITEVDGPVHEQQVEYDAERDRVLAGRGLRILHVTNDEVLHDLPGVLDRITLAGVRG